MLKTPGTLELALRFPSLAASLGLDERPWTAESTLLKGSVADMMGSSLILLVIKESSNEVSHECIVRQRRWWGLCGAWESRSSFDEVDEVDGVC